MDKEQLLKIRNNIIDSSDVAFDDALEMLIFNNYFDRTEKELYAFRLGWYSMFDHVYDIIEDLIKEDS